MRHITTKFVLVIALFTMLSGKVDTASSLDDAVDYQGPKEYSSEELLSNKRLNISDIGISDGRKRQ